VLNKLGYRNRKETEPWKWKIQDFWWQRIAQFYSQGKSFQSQWKSSKIAITFIPGLHGEFPRYNRSLQLPDRNMELQICFTFVDPFCLPPFCSGFTDQIESASESETLVITDEWWSVNHKLYLSYSTLCSMLCTYCMWNTARRNAQNLQWIRGPEM
jgi:hypothetical protein